MVLNGKGDLHKINPDTQERIIELAKKYNYRPNLIARNLIKGRTMTLGLIVPNIRDSFYSTIAYYLENKSSEKGYKVLLGSSREDDKKEVDLLQTFEDQRVDGIMIASTQHNLPAIQRMHDEGFPIVLFDRNYPGTNLPAVHIDNFEGVSTLVKHMHSLGRLNVGYIGVDLDLTPLYDRQKGYSKTVTELSGREKLNMKIVSYKNHGEECAKAIDELIDQHVDAIIFETHYLALHGVRRINELGIKYPEDLSIASFGDHEVFSIFKPHVTAINLQAENIVESALDMLLSRIEGKGTAENHTVVISPLLLVRD